MDDTARVLKQLNAWLAENSEWLEACRTSAYDSQTYLNGDTWQQIGRHVDDLFNAACAFHDHTPGTLAAWRQQSTDPWIHNRRANFERIVPSYLQATGLLEPQELALLQKKSDVPPYVSDLHEALQRLHQLVLNDLVRLCESTLLPVSDWVPSAIGARVATRQAVFQGRSVLLTLQYDAHWRGHGRWSLRVDDRFVTSTACESAEAVETPPTAWADEVFATLGEKVVGGVRYLVPGGLPHPTTAPVPDDKNEDDEEPPDGAA